MKLSQTFAKRSRFISMAKDLSELGFCEDPAIVATMELEAVA